LITPVNLNFLLYTARLDCRVNYTTQYADMGNLLIGLANALYNPNFWKAAWVWGTEISEMIPRNGGTTKRRI
jgi:hypothetical protein